MRIAMPVADGKLCMHFGHCQAFAFVDADEDKNIVHVSAEQPPAHQPGVLPRWLGEKSVDAVVAGGMGMRAQALFEEQGIEVVVGAPGGTPEEVAAAYLNGTLRTGPNVCDH